MKIRNLAMLCLLGAVSALSACGKSEPKLEGAPSVVKAEAASSGPAAGATEMGMAVYPGAENLMASRRIAGDQSGSMYDSAYKSADKPEKVAAFYRDELGKLASDKTKITDTPMAEGAVRLMGGKDESKWYDIMIRPEGSDTIFSIKTIVKTK